MAHRAHLFSLRIFHAFRESCLEEGYSGAKFRKDLLAGLTIGVIAIPLAMALAIASGVAPQYGLYTAAIAGFIIAFTGGSRLSISGPTAAFVVILYPITQKYGLGGLMLATLMAGAILIAMAIFRLGRLIEYIPETVTLGFTGGIAVVIAVLQLNDFFGLSIEAMPVHFLEKIDVLVHSMGLAHGPSIVVASSTLLVMIVWPRLKTPVPAHLPALLAGSIVALAFNHGGFNVDTIATRFSYIDADGTTGYGIPPILPVFQWPWARPGASGEPLVLSWMLLRDLLPAAFAIAMLGAIESLLCAVVLDGMSGKRHSANSELLGQGIGNLVAPFFGGITATAALARSAANYKAGAVTPVAGMVHAIVVVLALVGLTSLLGYLPMPAMAAMLMVVAWNMSEAPKSVHLLKTSQTGDRLVFLCCFLLTVLFDMVIAITTGTLLAVVLFMKQIADMTRVVEISGDQRYTGGVPAPNVRIFKITGPLFFAAADKIFGELMQYCQPGRTIILYLDNVTMLDNGGVSSLARLIQFCEGKDTRLVLTDLNFQPLKALTRANLRPIEGRFKLYPNLQEAISAQT